MTLTDNDLILYLLSFLRGEDTMKGTIRAKGHCPVCQGNFTEVKKLGFVCPTDKTTPKRFFIDLFYQGKRLKLYSDNQGQVIDSYQRASTLLAHINYEIKHHTFDPTKYVKQELEKFYVSNLLDKFLSHKLDTLAPSYRHAYKLYVMYAKAFFKATDIRDLRKLDVINYLDYLKKNYTFSGKTIKNILDHFKTFLRYAMNDLEILDSIPMFPSVEYSEPQINWLSPELQKRVYESIPIDDKPIIAFLMLTGCRPGEARALKCKDVNLDLGVITISATFSGRVYQKKRKGRKAKDVVIPIHPEIIDYIKDRVTNNLPEAFLFVYKKTGQHYTEDKLKRMWDKVKEKTGLPKGIRLYDATRHSFASQLINNGVSLISVSRLLGHSSVKMTEKYAHSDIERLKFDMSSISLNKEIIKLEESQKVGNS